MDIDPTCLSLQDSLNQIEHYLTSTLHLSIPLPFPNTESSRIQSTLKILNGLDKLIILELLPQILSLLEDSSAYQAILDLLLRVLSENTEVIFEMLIKCSKNSKIKKNCLSLFKELVEKGNIKGLHRVMHSLADVLNDADKETAQFARSVGRKIRDTIFRTSPPVKGVSTNGLIFNVIPPQLYEEYTSSDNKKSKLIALKSIEEILSNLTDPEILKPFEAEILALLQENLSSSNKSFVGSGLRIALSVVSADLDFSKLFSVLKTKLADPAIPYRKSAFKILLQCIMKNPTLPHELLPGLSNENWHVREETINLYIGGLLKGMQYDKVDLISVLARLLDDEKSKIRQATQEALAVIGKLKGYQPLLEKLQPIVDELELARLKSRFEMDTIAKIENNLVVYPKTLPTSAPISFASGTLSPPANSTFMSRFNGTSFSPTPTITQEFRTSIPVENTPGPRSSSLASKETSSIFSDLKGISKIESDDKSFLKNSNLLKPPLPRKSDSKKQLQITVEETKKSVVDKTYTNWNELEALKQPLDDIARYSNITEDNWEKQFEATDVYRKIVKFHKDLLNSQMTHKIMMDLVKWGDSLRSALSKNSIIAVGEFCVNIHKQLDIDIECIMNLLLRKSTDTNIFISEAAVESLTQCVENCNLSRVVNCIIGHIATAKSGGLKSKLALCGKCILIKVGKNIPAGVDKILVTVAGYIQEASAEVRESARECFAVLGSDRDKILGKYLPENVLKSVREILDREARRNTQKADTKKRTLSINETVRSNSKRSSSNRLRTLKKGESQPSLATESKVKLPRIKVGKN